jgi:DNA ligase (NAD+)
MTEPLIEKYFEFISKKFNLSKPKTAKYIDKCIRQTAASLNLEYSKVYKQIYTEEVLSECLLRSRECSKLELEDCQKACHCFYLEPYGCLPRKLPNAEKINKNPDAYIKKYLGNTKDLERMVKIAAYLYHNYDGGGLTDNSYDALEYHLNQRLRLKGRRFEKIGAPPVEKIRVPLPYPMPSLNKVKPNMSMLYTFLDQFAEDDQAKCLWSLKLDGVSGMLVYNSSGKLKNIYTRGDGEVGGKVTYLKDYIKNIPQKVDISNLIVRGEFIIKKETWKQKYKDSYSNARSFVSGKINAGYMAPSLLDVDFVAYQIMSMEDKKRVPSPSQSIKLLEAEDFLTVEYGLLTAPTAFDIIQLYKQKRDEAIYYIDGLVLTGDWEKLAVTSGAETINPLGTIAFKMVLEEQIRDTSVTNVEWNITRYGRYFPVVIYNSVYIDGVRLHRATGHNAKHILDWNMGLGTKIKVFRSGDVIPQIKDVDVDESLSPILPITQEEGGCDWHWERSDIVLNEIENNEDVIFKRSVHFFSTLGVPKLKEGNVKRFTLAGYKTPEEISKLSIKDMVKIKGIGQKTAEVFYHGIRNAFLTVPPDRFLIATTTFKSGLGRKTAKTLFLNIPHILSMSEGEILNYFKKNKLKGFGPARIKGVATSIPKFKEYLNSFDSLEIDKGIKNYQKRMKNIKRNRHIAGKMFVLTGFMDKDYDFEDYIYENGGDIVDSVTSSTEAVISKNVSNITKKMLNAYELKIPVLTIPEFKKRYQVSF